MKQRTRREQIMKRIAALAVAAGAMGVVPAVASAYVSPQPAVMKPAVPKPVVVRSAVVKPVLVRSLVGRAVVKPLPVKSFSLRVTTLSRVYTVAR
jgi:hypothetical protein